MKLYYFDGRGRAEAARVILTYGEVPFEEVRFKREEWMSTYKAMSPTGQCPFLELDDGSILTQSLAINMYVSNLAGILPSDPLLLARSVELSQTFEDVRGLL
jgi:prostaglandin-H2 D-isomerase / glutathione transferase